MLASRSLRRSAGREYSLKAFFHKATELGVSKYNEPCAFERK
jgi:hypothetical protein